jgi:hypothetical protein
MPQFVLAHLLALIFHGSKGALYRETLQATGFYVGRVVIATAGFAPIPPFRATPAVIIPTAIGCVFQGMAESIHPMADF